VSVKNKKGGKKKALLCHSDPGGLCQVVQLTNAPYKLFTGYNCLKNSDPLCDENPGH